MREENVGRQVPGLAHHVGAEARITCSSALRYGFAVRHVHSRVCGVRIAEAAASEASGPDRVSGRASDERAPAHACCRGGAVKRTK